MVCTNNAASARSEKLRIKTTTSTPGTAVFGYKLLVLDDYSSVEYFEDKLEQKPVVVERGVKGRDVSYLMRK